MLLTTTSPFGYSSFQKEESRRYHARLSSTLLRKRDRK